MNNLNRVILLTAYFVFLERRVTVIERQVAAVARLLYLIEEARK